MSKSRFVRKKLFCMLLIGVLVFAFTGCASNKLEGSWIPSDMNMSYFKYPESMSLNSGGTGIVDGFLVDWKEDNGVIYFYTAYGTISFEYRFEGQTLYLDDRPYKRGN